MLCFCSKIETFSVFLGGEREAGTLYTVNRSDEEPPEWEAQLEVGVDDRHPHYYWGKEMKYCRSFVPDT